METQSVPRGWRLGSIRALLVAVFLLAFVFDARASEEEAKSFVDSIAWRGNEPVTVDGRSLAMQRLEDTAGDSEWILACDGM